MRRVILWNLITLDAFFEGKKTWDIDFHEQVWGEELEQYSLDQLRSADSLLFGRVTYEGMAAYWPSAKGEIADLMNGIPKVVFSRTLTTADWSNTRLVPESPELEVARLKREPGKNILIFGSGTLSAALTHHKLIDEYRLGLTPVVLGGGKPLFGPAPEPFPMKLIEAKPLKSGCVLLRYEPDRKS